MISSISFSITSFGNSRKSLDRCITSIQKQGVPDREILIYGKEEISDTKNYYNEKCQEMEHLNKIRNLLFSRAEKEFVALVDAGVELSPDWYENIKQADCFDVIGSQLIVDGIKRCVDWGYAAEIGKKLLYLPIDYDEWSRRAFINGTLILLRKKVFEHIRFSDKLGSWEGDDLDFCTRASEIGFRVGVIPEAKAVWRPDPRLDVYQKYISTEKAFEIIDRNKKAYAKYKNNFFQRMLHVLRLLKLNI